MQVTPIVREATEPDLPAILAIYNEVIASSTAVYSLEPSTLEERRAWFRSRCSIGFPVLVAMGSANNDVLGFASLGSGEAHGRGTATQSSTRFTYGMMFARKVWDGRWLRLCFRVRLRWEST